MSTYTYYIGSHTNRDHPGEKEVEIEWENSAIPVACTSATPVTYSGGSSINAV